MVPRYDGPHSGVQPEAGAARTPLERARYYLDRVGLRPLNDREIGHIKRTYSLGLQEAKSGDPRRLKMSDTMVDLESVTGPFPPGKTIWVIEVGGTNLRGAMYTTGEDGQPHKAKIPVAGRRGEMREASMSIPLPKDKHFASLDAFTEMAVEQLTVLGGAPPDACAYIFSFSGTPVKNGTNIDVRFYGENLPAIEAKGFSFPGIENELVGEAFNRALMKKHTQITEPPPYALMNDTPILAISEPDSNLGLVVGTGANFGAKLGDTLYNTALASFHEAPIYPLFQRMDPSRLSSAFKEIGGLHLGKIMTLAVQRLKSNGIIDVDLQLGEGGKEREITANDMANILHGEEGEHKFQRLFTGNLNQETQTILREVAQRIFDRSAELMGIFLATFINTFPTEFNNHERIPSMGSVLHETPGYKQLLTDTIHKHLEHGRTVEITYDADAGMRGITYAALHVLQATEAEQAA